MERKPARFWTGTLMMTVSILAVCIVVPTGFMAGGPFSRWLSSMGIHTSPNLAGGYTIAEFSGFERVVSDPPPGLDPAEIQKALALRRFSVNKVRFRRWSGMGIEPRLNLSFEFEGRLPDPQNSPSGFSLTAIHVYIQTPGHDPGPASSERAVKADFGGPGWNYEVIVDGLHDQARIFDNRGNLVATGLGLYVDHEMVPGTNQENSGGVDSGTRRITAALPLEKVGDPARGEWRFYLLAGIADSRHPTMMWHSMPDGRLRVFSGALMPNQPPAEQGRPLLRPLEIKNPS